MYLCPEEVSNQSDPNTTTSSNADSACSTSNTSGSGDDSFFSEDSTSCDSFRGIVLFIVILPNLTISINKGR